MAATQIANRQQIADAVHNTITVGEFALGSEPAAPTAGILTYGRKIVNRVNLATKDDIFAAVREYQPAFYTSNPSYWAAGGTGNITTFFGRRELVGTATNAQQVSTNVFTKAKRATLATAATAASTNQLRGGGLTYSRDCGIFYVCHFGVSAYISTTKFFIGFHSSNSTPASTTVPSAMTNVMGFAIDNGDTNIQWMTNDGSGTATKTDLGSNFPANTSLTDWYEARIYAPAGGSVVYYYLLNIRTGLYVEGSSTTDLVVSSQYLQDLQWNTNGITAAVSSIDLSFVYIETENV
jgi:hypothetical protein